MTESTNAPTTQPIKVPRLPGTKGVSGFDLGSGRLKEVSGLDLGSGRLKDS